MIKKRSARTTLLACMGIASLALLAGASPAAAKTKTKTFNQCVSTSQVVREGQTGVPASTANVVFPIGVPKFNGKPQNGTVVSVNSVGLRITHTFAGDIGANLVTPGGKVILLANHRGDIGDGYGTGAQSCSGSLVTFGDTFGTSIVTPGNTGNNPITGSFKPEQPLSGAVGGPARGNWVVLVEDTAGGDQGTLDAVSLNVTYRYKVKPKK